MTPRQFDPDVVQRRLRAIEDLLEDLIAIGDVTAERLGKDRLVRHAVERILSQLVDLAVSINGHVAATECGRAPTDYRDSYRLAADAGLIDSELAGRLQPSVGMRNVLAHEYVEIDLDLVARAATMAVEEYRAYVTQVARWLLSRG